MGKAARCQEPTCNRLTVPQHKQYPCTPCKTLNLFQLTSRRHTARRRRQRRRRIESPGTKQAQSQITFNNAPTHNTGVTRHAAASAADNYSRHCAKGSSNRSFSIKVTNRPSADRISLQGLLTSHHLYRSFSYLPSLRPTLHGAQGIFRSHQSPLLPTTTTTTLAAEGGSAVLDLVPKSFISAHPALAGIASQIRCGPRPTMSNASRLIQKRRHGFLSRIRTNKGRKVLAARKAKGRRRLAA